MSIENKFKRQPEELDYLGKRKESSEVPPKFRGVKSGVKNEEKKVFRMDEATQKEVAEKIKAIQEELKALKKKIDAPEDESESQN